MKRLLMTTGLLLFTLSAVAQTDEPVVRDTITVTSYVDRGPTQIMPPIMSDSVNMKGMTYNAMSLLDQIPYQVNALPGNPFIIATDGFIHNKSVIVPKNTYTIYTFETYPLTVNYEQGDLLIDASLPFRAFLDGMLIAKGKAKVDKAEQIETQRASLTFMPSGHRLTIQMMGMPGDTITPILRLRYVPDGERNTTIFRNKYKEYLSLDYMMSGENLSTVSVSPSGRYTLLYKSFLVNDKTNYTQLLYKGDRLISTLDKSHGYMKWMPKSDLLYFTRETDYGIQLVYLDPATLQEEVKYTSIPEGAFTISPNESLLVYTEDQEGPKYQKTLDRVVSREDRIPGFRKRSFLAIFDLKSGIYHPLTYGYRTTRLQDINGNDDRLIFSTSHQLGGEPFEERDFIEIDLPTMQVDTLFAGTPSISSVMYTPDQNTLLILGDANAFNGVGCNLPDDMTVNAFDNQLFIYHRDSKKAIPITKEFNPSIKNVIVQRDRPYAYFTAEDMDRVSLYQCNLKSGKITEIKTTEEVVRNFDVSDYGFELAYTGESANNSQRFYQLNLKKNRETLVYDLAKTKMKDLILGEVKDWDYTMPNGDIVKGRYYLPPNFDPNKKYPMIVYYYGGTSPTPRLFEWAYSQPMYAAQGYIVYVLNPSGATGFGQEYAARHVNAWGKRTADEIVAATKGFCTAHPFVNSKKIGCMGASYGGFMTQYLQTITDIFAAAVSHAGISDITSYWGEGFWGVGYSAIASAKSYPWNNPDLYVGQSPLFNADKINTPLLLLHGTADTNVPIGESVQMYNALKILGKEVEFVRVYGQNHFIQDPNKRRAWTETIFAWFDRWLKDNDTWWNDLYPPTHL